MINTTRIYSLEIWKWWISRKIELIFHIYNTLRNTLNTCLLLSLSVCYHFVGKAANLLSYCTMLTFQFCLQLGTHYYPNYISGFQEKSVFYFWKKMKYSLKHRSQQQKYMMMVCIMWQKIMKVDLKLKKNHNTEFETAFGVSVFKYCALCVSYLTTNFSDSHPTTRNLNVKILYDILITWWLF